MTQTPPPRPFGIDQAVTPTAPPTPVTYDPRLQLSLHQDAPVITDPAAAGPWMATVIKNDHTLPKWD